MQSTIAFAQPVAAAGDAFIVCDAQGAIVLWNASAERIFGFGQAEALVRSLDVIVRDETSRYTQDRELRKRLVELEAQLAARGRAA